MRGIALGTATAVAMICAGPADAAPSLFTLGLMVKACSQVEDDAKRLACYDAILSDASQADTAVDDDGKIAGWMVREETNPIDDKVSVTIARMSDEEYNTKYGSDKAVLAIACLEGEYRAWFAFRGSHLPKDEAPVTIRLDRDEPSVHLLSPSDNRKAYGMWDQKRVASFIDSLTGRQKIAVRAFDDDGRRIETVFSLSGLDKALPKVRAACP